ncbi:branched-chain amino acid ABC transporter permease [Dehalococcoides mccartyi]|nr:branched-chain amino acid ABC transporter permease [Dehalococcoides mccartyi]
MDLPCGTRNFSYKTDMAIFRTKTHWAMLIGFLILLFSLPFNISSYWLGILNLIGITVIAAAGLNILMGYCGQLSVGHAGFIAVGAYTTAILANKLGVPFPFDMIASGIMAGLVGVLFGLPSLRVKGFYLAISTIAAQFIIIWVINHWSGLTGGFNGIVIPPINLFNFDFTTQGSQFFIIMLVAVLAIFFMKNIARTRIGRAFVAIRDNDLAAEVMGINVFRYKLLAFFIGCFLAGVAGSLMAHWIGYLTAENFTLSDSILYVGIVIIGGLGTGVGPILGTLFIRLLQQGVQYVSPLMGSAFPQLPSGFAAGLGPMVFGLAIVLFLVLEPRGLAHRWQLFKSSYRYWPFSY